MNIIYKTLYYPFSPNLEYQQRKGVFYRRKKGSKNDWVVCDKSSQRILTEHFINNPPYYNINNSFKLAVILTTVYVGYKIYSKFIVTKRHK